VKVRTHVSAQHLPIKTLVSRRCEELSVSPAELVRRCGYRNVPKGLRRLEQLCQGDFGGSTGLVRTLHLALEVPADEVKAAVEETQLLLREAKEAAWRDAFRPHAIILTERSRPEPMWLAGILGVERLLRIDLDPAQGPVGYIGQALQGMRQKLASWQSDQLPAYGRPVALVVNYTPERAVRFDLEGNAIEVLDRAHRIGDVQLFLGGRRPITREELDAIFLGG